MFLPLNPTPAPGFKVLLRELKPAFKGIFQPFELGGVTRLIRSAVKFWKAGNLKVFF
jgi:hypothetical protein